MASNDSMQYKALSKEEVANEGGNLTGFPIFSSLWIETPILSSSTPVEERLFLGGGGGTGGMGVDSGVVRALSLFLWRSHTLLFSGCVQS
jgi:hypothetical protein